MRRLIVLPVFTLAFVVVAFTVAGQSPELWLGSWKLNAAKSTYSPGPTPTAKSNVSTFEALGGGQFKNTQDVVDAKGQTTHTEIMFRFDGADNPMKGAAAPTTRAYRRIDDRTWEFVAKVNGKVTTTSRSVLSPDGKTRVFTSTGTNAQGQPTKNVLIWERQ